MFIKLQTKTLSKQALTFNGNYKSHNFIEPIPRLGFGLHPRFVQLGAHPVHVGGRDVWGHHEVGRTKTASDQSPPRHGWRRRRHLTLVFEWNEQSAKSDF